MKIYKYTFNTIGKYRVIVEELEAEEKPNIYSIKGRYGYHRKRKNELDKASQNLDEPMFSLSAKNKKEYTSALIERRKGEILQFQEQIEKLNKQIEFLKTVN